MHVYIGLFEMVAYLFESRGTKNWKKQLGTICGQNEENPICAFFFFSNIFHVSGDCQCVHKGDVQF